MATKSQATDYELERSFADEADAWSRYLEETQGLQTVDYEMVEPFAWSKLKAKLGRIRAHRRAIRG